MAAGLIGTNSNYTASASSLAISKPSSYTGVEFNLLMAVSVGAAFVNLPSPWITYDRHSGFYGNVVTGYYIGPLSDSSVTVSTQVTAEISGAWLACDGVDSLDPFGGEYGPLELTTYTDSHTSGTWALLDESAYIPFCSVAVEYLGRDAVDHDVRNMSRVGETLRLNGSTSMTYGRGFASGQTDTDVNLDWSASTRCAYAFLMVKSGTYVPPGPSFTRDGVAGSSISTESGVSASSISTVDGVVA